MDFFASWLAHVWNILMDAIGADSLITDSYCNADNLNIGIMCEQPAEGWIILVVLLFIIGGWVKKKHEKNKE